jgi:hypothetical protein
MSTSQDRIPTPDEAWNQWTGLIARSMEAQGRFTRDATEALRRAGAQTDIPASLLDRDQLEAWGREGLQYWNDLMSLGVGYVNNVVEVTQHAAERLLRDVDVAMRPSSTHVVVDRVPVELSGVVGEPITTQVTVSNTRGAARRVEFEVGRFSGPNGPFHPHVTFDPAHSTLSPGQERQITMRLEIDPKEVVAGDVCRGEIRIVGGDDVVLVLTIRIG